MHVKIRFLGHSAFLLEAGEARVMIDPFLTGNPKAEEAGLKADDFDPTHIVLTHGHADHLGDTPALAKRTGCEVIAPFEICEWLGSEHGHEHTNPGNPGGHVGTSFGGVTFTHAIHSSSYEGRYMGCPTGVVVSIGGKTIYHAGDTSLFADMRRIGENHMPHVAILPVGDRFTMGPKDAKTAAEWIGAKITIPCHYGTWPLLTDDLSAFTPDGVEVRKLKAGETLEI